MRGDAAARGGDSLTPQNPSRAVTAPHFPSCSTPEPSTEDTIVEKYRSIAAIYDLLSAEYPVYRAGRVAGIALLAPQPGAQVLDVGCGTGLNFPLLQSGVGEDGVIVGIDRSPEMLHQARRRARRHGWENVILLQADATTLVEDLDALVGQITAQGGRPCADAALATYALSLMQDWEAAWAGMLGLCGPEARLAVVDMQDPVGRWSVMTPLARAACLLAGSDITAHPWQALERDCVSVQADSARGEHVQIRVGRVPARG